MFCSKCGTKITEDNKFCPNCGTPVKKIITEPSYDQNDTGKEFDHMNQQQPNSMQQQPDSMQQQLDSMQQQANYIQQQSNNILQQPNDMQQQLNYIQQPNTMQQQYDPNQAKKPTDKKKVIAFSVGALILIAVVTVAIVLLTKKEEEPDTDDVTITVPIEDDSSDIEPTTDSQIPDMTEDQSKDDVAEDQVVEPETEETLLAKEIKALNSIDTTMEKISVFELNYEPAKRKTSYKWNPKLFYSLEEISPDSEKDGLINSYIIEKKQLMNADTNNTMEYEIYRDPDTGIINKIVSIEYKSDVLEITDYYYDDKGKVNFVFVREDINYVPSYAVPSKLGKRYYFNKDTMVKWRVVDDKGQVNYVAGKEEKDRGGNAGKVVLYKKLSDDKQKKYNKVEKDILNAAYNTYNTVLKAKGVSNIIGYVTDGYQQPLEGATVQLYLNDNDTELYNCVTQNDGKYQIFIPSDERNYRIEVSKDDYAKTSLYDISMSNQLIGVYQETICLVGANQLEECNTQLIICDAFNRSDDNNGMRRLANADIRIRNGLNNKTGQLCGNTTTDSEGIVYVSLKPGMYTVEVSKAGYANTYYTISVVENNMKININTSPILNDNEVRVVLTWDQVPRDLDSHLFTPYDSSSGDTTYHIWYGNAFDNNANNLDVDDTDGYGPETMTINNLGNGLYKYYVADYSNCSSGNTESMELSYSNATVDIYTKDGLVKTFHVPANRSGVIWEVFEIRNKTIVPIQRYYNTIEDKTWWNNQK